MQVMWLLLKYGIWTYLKFGLAVIYFNQQTVSICMISRIYGRNVHFGSERGVFEGFLFGGSAVVSNDRFMPIKLSRTKKKLYVLPLEARC